LSELNIPEDDDDNALDSGPETQLLPLDLWHREHGGRMVEFAGYWMPVQYEGIIAEHLWTRESAGLFDVSHMGQLGVSGPDGDQAIAAAALEMLLPGDIAALKPGRMRYSLLLDESGGILDDLIVLNTGHDFAIVVNGATKWDDIAHMREHLADEITLSHHDEQGLLALQGPKAVNALARLGLVPHDDGVPLTALKFMQAGIYDWVGDWGSRRLGISRSGYTGEDGFEISVHGEHITALADALCEQPEVKPIGLGARDSLRLEAGLPLYGHDLTPDTDPVSAGLGFALSKRRREQGGFPGAERIFSLLGHGTATARVGLALEGRQAAREGASVWSAGQQVGTVTSGGFSPTLQRPIAMAYIERPCAAEGAALEVEVRGKRLTASVVPLPFVPHRYIR
jgi:aminomethyltransferase